MLDLRSHRKSPYQESLVSHRRSSSRTATRGSSVSLLPLGRLDDEPAATKSTTGRFHSGQTTLSLRTPERRRLRLFRSTQKLNQQQTHIQQQEQEQEQEQQQQQEQQHVRQHFCEGVAMDTEVEVVEPMSVSAIVDRETSSMDVDVDVDKVPAILRLCPEVLALIFHYVYVTPVVHRPPAVVVAKSSSSSDTEMQQEPQAQTLQQQGQNQQESPVPVAVEEDRSSSLDMSTITPTSSLSSPPSSSLSTSPSTSSFASTEPTRAGATTETEIITSDSTTTTTTTNSGASTLTTRRTRKDKRVSLSSVYIQNDLSSMLSLCLTCRTFYPQAIRMLWRQRTLTNFDELTQFYQAIDFSAALTKRHQKQRHLLQQQQQQQQELRRLGLGMGYVMEEGLFTNKAALRIKSLTLLDMSLGSSLATLPLAAVVASANASSSLSSSGESALSSQFFGSSSNHAGGDPASLDLCQGIDSLPRTSSTLDDSLAMAGLSKEDATMANTSTSSSSSSSSGSSSMSSSSSSSSSALAPHSPAQTRRRHRQKTASIYSDMVSPRLLHTIAHHCHALVDLTLCMDKKSTNGISHNSSAPPAVHQPTIPLSILAGSLLSLKRLALMGLVCDSQQNKTASELFVFAQNIQPLEQLSIRSCQGIGLETFVEFASRSNRRLLSVDFQGLDFKTSQELTDVMAAYAAHCRSVKSVTLSCLNSLALDGMLEALAYYGASELQELHVLGHDTLLTPAQIQQQQQQGLAGAPAPGAIPQQEQQQQPQQQQPADNNNNADGGVPVPFTQMCHLADANAALSSLTRIPLRRLTLYCPGITDYALLLYLAQAKQLVDLVLQEPTTMVIHHPQFHNFVQQYHPTGPPPASTSDSDQSTPQALMGSSSFLGLIRARCTGLKYLFMKLTLETAQEWIAQECFRQAGLDKCLYQYRTATGAPAVVLMWDSRARQNAVADAAGTAAILA
ncbi:hypothetical protein EC991_008646 [Linnemannia zychae]|nr:hypothetical protein EC991_008646 [Linnemannia zychae]